MFSEGLDDFVMKDESKKARKLPQYFAALTGALGGFCMGSAIGWSNPIEERVLAGDYGFPVAPTDFSFISGLLSLGGAFGSLLSGPVSERLGRKTYILMSLVPSIAGWLLVIFNTSLIMLFIGRFLLGMGVGGFSCVCPQYTNEIAQKDIRGLLGTSFQQFVAFGLLFSFVVGAFTTLTEFSSICLVMPVIFGLAMLAQPETPYFYLLKGNRKDAERSMRRLRGQDYNFDVELKNFQLLIDEKKNSNPREALKKRSSIKGLLLGNILMAFQQLCGIGAFEYFASSIFQDAGTSLDPNICTIITGVCSVSGTAISTQVVERSGRKTLLILSPLVMGLSSATLGVYFFLDVHLPQALDNAFMQVLPILAVCLFVVAFAMGYGPVSWLYTAEVLPPEIKGVGSGVACLVVWMSSFVVSFGYPSVNAALKPNFIYLPFWVFAFVGIFGVLFALTMVIETKGRTLNQINDELETGKIIKWRGCF